VVCGLTFAFRAPLLERIARGLCRSDEPVHADVIVVLGGDSSFRVAKAVELWKQGFATRIALTGPDPEFPELEIPSYARWLALLDTVGVPRDSVDVLHPSYSTFDDARLVKQFVVAHGWRSALLVTDPYHTWRSGWIVRRTLEGTGVVSRMVSSDPPWFHPERWWKDERQLLFVGMEYVKVAYYVRNYGWSGPLRGEPRGIHDQGKF